jgi:DNA-binding transcriptional LysR family regulator
VAAPRREQGCIFAAGGKSANGNSVMLSITSVNMELHRIDLNLLVVFRELLRERRVSRVAEKLGISQPAVSNALARLRRLLGNPLFLRTPQGMAPTPYAEQLAAPLEQALDAIQAALSQRTDFDPAHSERAFTLGMTDIGEIWFLPALMDRLAHEAPGVSISTVRNGALDLKEAMEAGKVDLALGLLPQLQAGFYQRRLLHTRYVCLFRRGHPLDGAPLGVPEYEAAEHLLVVAQGTGHGRVDELLLRAGIRRRIRLTVPHFTAVGHILQRTDLLATVPEALAQSIAEPFGLVHVPHPAALPEAAINLFWHAKVHEDAGNSWLRGVVKEVFG